jgi:hypothetical protein
MIPTAAGFSCSNLGLYLLEPFRLVFLLLTESMCESAAAKRENADVTYFRVAGIRGLNRTLLIKVHQVRKPETQNTLHRNAISSAAYEACN